MRASRLRRRVVSEQLLSNAGTLAVIVFFLTAIGAVLFSIIR